MYAWDEQKRRTVLAKRNIDLAWIREVCERPYVEDRKNDDPEQFRIVGIHEGRYITFIVEYSQDELGDLVWVVTAWSSTMEERQSYEEEIKGT
jgi:uncharacterized DUF497 family protein